jgi:hypothetical protein
MLLLRVYILPDGPRSQLVLHEALAFRDLHEGYLEVQVIDAARCPELAVQDGVFVFPAVVLTSDGTPDGGIPLAAVLPGEPVREAQQPTLPPTSPPRAMERLVVSSAERALSSAD